MGIDQQIMFSIRYKPLLPHNKPIVRPFHASRIQSLLSTNQNFTLDREDDVYKGISEKELYAMFDEMLKKTVLKYNVGDRVVGTVVSMDKKFVYVDMGLKDFALLPREEVSLGGGRAEELVAVGEAREFLVIRVSDREIQPVVSLRAIEVELVWERARQFLEVDAILEVPIIEITKGGYRVDIGGFKSFLPVSQMHPQYMIGDLSGKTIPVKLVDVDETKNRCVCSNRKAMLEDENAASILADLSIGDVVHCYVQNITSFGVFVDLNGVAGLLHISQISNDRINTTDAIFQIGEPIKCMVLAVDKEKGRLSLTTKKLEPTPGDMLRNRGLVMEKAQTMARLFRQRVMVAQAAVDDSKSI